MRYKALLVDLDDTLLDYATAERLSLTETLASFGIPSDDAVCRAYNAINRDLWAQREQGLITRAQLRSMRFTRLFTEIGCPVAWTDEANQRYSARLCMHGETAPGAEELLQSLHGRVKIAAVTNGVTRVQRSRLAQTPLLPLLDAVIISEEVGLQKPDPAIILCALKTLGIHEPSTAVMLGDSLQADIAAARSAGIDCIWLNQDGTYSDEATFCVKSLHEAKELLTGVLQ